MLPSHDRGLAINDPRLRAAAALLVDMGASEVFLFGSATRNELRPDSDIDIAVRGLPPAQFFAAASKATDALGRPVDLMELEDRSPAVRYVLGSGELIRVV
ncbi:MAG: hypothetical protein JWN34_3673 [Bryobacterales bacterium]|jgi:predicted nucleotidyltransferase|nr:hypothetical protein [Bryobacterales bacterium]